MNNVLSYCGLDDARISASEKDVPVTRVRTRVYMVCDSSEFGSIGQFIIHKFLVLFMTILSSI